MPSCSNAIRHAFQRLVRKGMRHLFEQARGHGGEEAIEDLLYLIRNLPAIRKTFVVSRDTGFFGRSIP